MTSPFDMRSMATSKTASAHLPWGVPVVDTWNGPSKQEAMLAPDMGFNVLANGNWESGLGFDMDDEMGGGPILSSTAGSKAEATEDNVYRDGNGASCGNQPSYDLDTIMLDVDNGAVSVAADVPGYTNRRSAPSGRNHVQQAPSSARLPSWRLQREASAPTKEVKNPSISQGRPRPPQPERNELFSAFEATIGTPTAGGAGVTSSSDRPTTAKAEHALQPPVSNGNAVDMGHISVPDLLDGINEDLLADMRQMAPDIVEALMKQEQTSGVFFQPTPAGASDTHKRKHARADDNNAALTYDKSTLFASRNNPPSMDTDDQDLQSNASKRRAFGTLTETTDMNSSMTNEDPDQKKVQRAEKNRISAARSREKKRAHIEELKRRVTMLSAENAQLQVEQLRVFQERIEKEHMLRLERKELELKVDKSKEKLAETRNKLRQHGIAIENTKRHTWSSGEWHQNRSGGS